MVAIVRVVIARVHATNPATVWHSFFAAFTTFTVFNDTTVPTAIGEPAWFARQGLDHQFGTMVAIFRVVIARVHATNPATVWHSFFAAFTTFTVFNDTTVPTAIGEPAWFARPWGCHLNDPIRNHIG